MEPIVNDLEGTMTQPALPVPSNREVFVQTEGFCSVRYTCLGSLSLVFGFREFIHKIVIVLQNLFYK